jgi:hypothetical protein
MTDENPPSFPDSLSESTNMQHVDQVATRIRSTRSLVRKIPLIDTFFAKLVSIVPVLLASSLMLLPGYSRHSSLADRFSGRNLLMSSRKQCWNY